MAAAKVYISKKDTIFDDWDYYGATELVDHLIQDGSKECDRLSTLNQNNRFNYLMNCSFDDGSAIKSLFIGLDNFVRDWSTGLGMK